MTRKFWSTAFTAQVNRSAKVTISGQDTVDCFCVALGLKSTFKSKAH